jgi:hypothetical protein
MRTGYCYRVVSYKASRAFATIVWYVLPFWVLVIPDLSNRVSAAVAAETSGSEAGRNRARIAAEFCLSVSLSCLKGSLTCRKILRRGADGFTSTSKEVVLRTYIALINQSPSAGFEPANLGSNGKHDDHHTTENDTWMRSTTTRTLQQNQIVECQAITQVGIIPQIRPRPLPSTSFQFIIHLSPFTSTRYR